MDKIIFLGLDGLGSDILLEAHKVFKIQAVVTASSQSYLKYLYSRYYLNTNRNFATNNYKKKIKRISRKLHISCYQIGDVDELSSILDKYEFDFIFVATFNKIIPSKLLKKYVFFNLHPSLLPLNKGANPEVWAKILMNRYGISIHVMSDRVDGGEVVVQIEIIISHSDNGLNIRNKVLKNVPTLLKIFNNYLTSKEKVLVNSIEESYQSPFFFKDSEIKNQNIVDMYNQINATFPFYTSYIVKDNKRLYIKKCHILNTKQNLKKHNSKECIKVGSKYLALEII